MSTSGVKVDWMVPSEEWDRFIDWVDEKRPSVGAYLGYEVESAMEEYANIDSKLEDLIDELVSAAGRRPKDSNVEPSVISSLTNEETRRVQVRVDPHVKDEFRKVSKQSDNNYGVEFAIALRQYRNGGREDRLTRKLDRVTDDAASILSSLDDGESGTSMTKSERITVKIANELPKMFDSSMLRDEIREYGGDSEYYFDRYSEAVIERLDVRRFDRDDEPDLFMPPKQWRERILGGVIEDLGGDCVDDTCPSFTREKVLRVLDKNGIEATRDNREQVNEFIDRLLDRLGFEWDENDGKFVPEKDASSTLNNSKVFEYTDSTPDLKNKAESELDAIISGQPMSDGGCNQQMATDGGSEFTG